MMKRLFTYELRGAHKAPCRRENPWAIRNPLDEARDLHRMMSYSSSTVESIRELIAVPAKVEAALLAFADRYPKDGQRIHCVLRFRRKVAEEFERLVQRDFSLIEHPGTEIEQRTFDVAGTLR